MKKVLSLLLVTLLLVASVPVFADDVAETVPDFKFIATFDADDVTGTKMLNVYNFWNNYDASARANASSTNTRLSDYSAQMGPLGTGGYQYFHILCFGDEGVDRTGYDYINFVIYSNTAITLPSYLVDATGDTGMLNDSGSNSGWFSLKQGWNVVTLGLNRRQNTDPNKADFAFADNTTIKEINIVVASDSLTIPTGVDLLNEGTSVKQQPGFSDATIYVDAIYLSKTAPTAPAVTGTSIANGATGISRNLDEYVVTFDSEMSAKSLTTETLTVKEIDAETETETPVVVKSVTANGNTATIAFNEDSLKVGTEYTVTVSGDVYNAYGLELGADETYTFATSPYDISGIYAGEKLLMNVSGARNRVRTVGLNTTENVEEVVYKLDGVEAATATAEHFTWDMPLDAVASHSLSAVVTDTAGATHELAPVSFDVMYANPVAFKSDDFEGAIDEAIPTGTGTTFTYITADAGVSRGTITYAADPAGIKEDTVLKAVKTNAESNDFAFGFTVTKPSNVIQIDVDVYLYNPSNVFMRIDQHSPYGGSSFKPYDLYQNVDKPAFKSGSAWNHVTVLMDCNALRYEVYVNGAFHKSGNLSIDFTKTTFGVLFAGQSTFYLDNVKVQTLEELTANEAMLDAVEFTATEDGWDADVVISNFAETEKECKVYLAVYDANGKVIAVDIKDLTVPADKISTTSYSVAKTRGDKVGAKVRGFVWESVSGELTLRPLAEIK